MADGGRGGRGESRGVRRRGEGARGGGGFAAGVAAGARSGVRASSVDSAQWPLAGHGFSSSTAGMMARRRAMKSMEPVSR